jgi:hypothetical protein
MQRAEGNPQLVDVPNTSECQDLFWRTLNNAPGHIQAEMHSKGSHTGQGTSWAGGYETWEIYDERRPAWPTEDAEKYRDEAEWSIVSHLQQTKVR